MPVYLYLVVYLLWGLRPPYRYGTRCNVARKLAQRNGGIIYGKAGTANPTLVLALLVCRVYPDVKASGQVAVQVSRHATGQWEPGHLGMKP